MPNAGESGKMDPSGGISRPAYPVVGGTAALMAMTLFAGCGSPPAGQEELAGKTYVCEKQGFGGDFSLTLNLDGTFQYYEGAILEPATGKWRGMS